MNSVGQPWASPRVAVWRTAKTGFVCEWGVLKVVLFDAASDWTISFYLRPGVQIGIVNPTYRLCMTNTPGALHVDGAKGWALTEADNWLSAANVDRLLALKPTDLPPATDPGRPLLSYNPVPRCVMCGARDNLSACVDCGAPMCAGHHAGVMRCYPCRGVKEYGK